MIPVFKRGFFFCAVLSIALSYNCSKAPLSVDNGSGTGVGNGVVMGKVLYPDSTPVANAQVRLRTYDYLADTSGIVPVKKDSAFATVTTDAFGNFRIDSLCTKHVYYIEVNDEKRNAQQATLYLDTFKTRDTLQLETRVVKPVKQITGGLTLNGLPVNAYVQIYGLEKVGRSDSTGQFTITDLPEGKCEEGECTYRLRITTVQSNGLTVGIDYKLEIEKENGVLQIELESGNDD